MNEKLYQLLQKAELDFELRKRIWAAKDAKDPALALCELCTAEGFPLTVGQLFSEQEEFFCNLFRSCNGSAVDPLDGWDDPFEMFFAALEALDKKEPKNMLSEKYEEWADEHEELEDYLDEILDRMEVLCK